MEEYGMTDKQYEGMLRDNIACLDRLAVKTNDKNMLNEILKERKLIEDKLGYKVPDDGLYSME